MSNPTGCNQYKPCGGGGGNVKGQPRHPGSHKLDSNYLQVSGFQGTLSRTKGSTARKNLAQKIKSYRAPYHTPEMLARMTKGGIHLINKHVRQMYGHKR